MPAESPNFDRQICPTCSAIFGMAYDLCPNDGTILIPGGGDELLGTTLAGKYVIDECIGEGGMGRVYRAHHTRLQKRTFAIKILLGDLAADPTMRKRFEQEAESASRLQHPNVVPVLDFGKTEGGLLYLVMEFVDGRPLSQLIKEGPLPESRVLAITQELCQGLGHAHSEGLVHRDFKPENVVISGEDQGGTPRILDFGLAIVRSAEEASVRLTGSGMMVGTPAYISPEQARAAPVDQRSDLFSLGISVYEMLAGRLPFTGDAIEIMYANTKLDAPSVSERNPKVSVSPEMEAIVRKLMARDPDERFQSAGEVLELLNLLSGNPNALTTDARFASLLAPSPRPLDSAQTARSWNPLEQDAAGDAPTVKRPSVGDGKGGTSKGKTVAFAVAAVLLAALAVFALLHFGGSSEGGAQPTEVLTPAVGKDGEEAQGIAPAEGSPDASAPEPAAIELEIATPDPARDIDVATENDTDALSDSSKTAEDSKVTRPPLGRKSARSRRSDSTTTKSKEGSADIGPLATQVVPPKDSLEAAPALAKEPPPPTIIPEPTPPTPKPPPPAPKPPAPVIPQVFDAQTSIKDFRARGSLSSRVVRRAVDRALPDLRTCYKEASRRAKKNKGGAVKVSLGINELGRASNVKVSSFALPGLSQCVSKRLGSVRTRVVPDVGTVSISLTLNFAPLK